MDSQEIQRLFDRAAETFDSVAFVHDRARQGLMERLQPMAIEAATIVDLGSATGAGSRLLARQFRRATVVPIDLSLGMARRAAKRSAWFTRNPAVQADACRLPLADQSVDIVFANLLLPWIDDRPRLFAEIVRVLRGDGLLLFSTLGPASLAGLSHKPFKDMHDIGDELVRAGLRDPVLDVDRLAVSYDDRESLERDLAGVGCEHCLPADSYPSRIELELIFGHCWGPGAHRSPGAVTIAADSIPKRRT